MLTTEQRTNMTELVAALRSGKYEQAGKYLSVDNLDGSFGYCCLGVACELSGKGHWTPERRYKIEEAGGEMYHMPSQVMKHYGFGNSRGFGVEVIPYGSIYTWWIDTLNDSGFTFNQIADLIEWEYLSHE